MAIIKCPECGNPVSDKAPYCPKCGIEIAGKIKSQTMTPPPVPPAESLLIHNHRKMKIKRMVREMYSLFVLLSR